MKKVCNRCDKEKPIEQFYKHPKMTDGRLNQCKVCKRLQQSKIRKKNIEYYREYDRARPYRVSKQPVDPIKRAARILVGNALRSGKLIKPDKCSSPDCLGDGTRIEAHHEDYYKPLEVVWLCSTCHSSLPF